MRNIFVLLLCVSPCFGQTAVFPAAIATDANLLVVKNRAQTTLVGSLNASDTSFTLASDAFGVNVAITIGSEIILIQTKTGATVNTSTRGYDNTAAASHISGSLASAFVDAWHHNSVTAEIKAIEAALGINLVNVPTPVYPIAVNKGGTAAITAPTARTSLGAAALGANGDITSLTALSTPLSVPQGGTGAGTLTGIPVAAGTAAITALAAASPLQYLRRQANVAGTVYEFATRPGALSSSDYDFPAQTPGGSLSIGANTITLTPCPLGVAGTHIVASNLPHLLYLSAGTGTAEAAPITGGTCTSGLSTGTIILTAANTHTGAWTVKSNSTGVQEAIYVAGATGAVKMPAGHVELWGNVCIGALCVTTNIPALTVPDGYSTSLRGSGVGDTAILTHGTTGDWLTFDFVASGGFIDAGDFQMVDNSGTPHTAGKMLNIRWRTDGVVDHIYLNQCYDCLVVERNARTTYDAITIGTYHYGLWIHCAGAHIATCQSTGSYSNILLSSAVAGGDAVRIEAPTAGITLTNVSMGAASNTSNNAVHLVAVDTGDPLNEIMFANCIVDGHQVGVRVAGNGVSYNSNSIQFIGGRINSAQIAVLLSGFVDNFSTNGTILVSAGAGGVGVDRAISLLGDVRNAAFMNSPKIATDGDACLIETGNASNITFSGNVCGDPVGSVRPQYAFTVVGTITGFDVKGNNLTNVVTGILNNSGALAAPIVWRDNTGIDNVIPAVTAASTTALPLNPIFTLTGATAVGTVTNPLGVGSVGQKFTFVATNASPGAWTAGATIGVTFTPTQNVPVNCFWDSVKLWCKP